MPLFSLPECFLAVEGAMLCNIVAGRAEASLVASSGLCRYFNRSHSSVFNSSKECKLWEDKQLYLYLYLVRWVHYMFWLYPLSPSRLPHTVMCSLC